jgi:hypothetical protein
LAPLPFTPGIRMLSSTALFLPVLVGSCYHVVLALIILLSWFTLTWLVVLRLDSHGYSSDTIHVDSLFDLFQRLSRDSFKLGSSLDNSVCRHSFNSIQFQRIQWLFFHTAIAVHSDSPFGLNPRLGTESRTDVHSRMSRTSLPMTLRHHPEAWHDHIGLPQLYLITKGRNIGNT